MGAVGGIFYGGKTMHAVGDGVGIYMVGGDALIVPLQPPTAQIK